MVNCLPTMWKTKVQSLGLEDPLEERMATHSSILAWRIPIDSGTWLVTVHGISQSRTQLSTFTFTFTFASPNTSTTEHHFHFGPATSLSLGLLVIVLHYSPVAYCTPSNLWGASSQVISFHTIHGILLTRTLEWFAIPSSTGSRFVRTLYHDPSVLSGPSWCGS